ncbi:MAG: PIG-L family deacetylase [Deltaproteobacteria bacterium]|nr:PIG-L family deacetylase [Deltaproteobacteria bacterium]
MDEVSWEKKFIAVQEGISLEDYRGRKNNILVIAPHPDDDVLGAGGTMAAASHQGKGVFAVYITDGRNSPRKDKNISDDEMAALRKKEALTALRAVGAVGGFFLEKRSGELAGGVKQEVEETLIRIFQLICPEEVFLPAPYERHLTHQLCTQLSIEALRMDSNLKPNLLGYSLWGCFWGVRRRIVRDITPIIKRKVEAVLAHSSQVAYKNYQQGILGKNNYEAIFWESHEIQKAAFVEIFLDMNELLENRNLTLAAFIRQDVEAFIQAFGLS